MNQPVLKLYVTGRTPRSERAIRNLRRIVDEKLGGNCRVTVIDILEQPEVAESERILATPTLVKEVPPPLRRIIGDLSETQKVIDGLDLGGLEGDPK